MKWQNLAVLVAGACLLFGFAYNCVPDEQKADTLVKCVVAITAVFSINFWFVLSIFLGLVAFVSFLLCLDARNNLKQLQKKYDSLLDEMRGKNNV